MARITKKVREDAALICGIAASTPGLRESYGSVCRALGISLNKRGASFDLALAAWSFCRHVEHPDAEAEALLRTGWTP